MFLEFLSFSLAVLLGFLLINVLKRENEKDKIKDMLEFQSTKVNCFCGKKIIVTGRFALIHVYTRSGTKTAKHIEKRCWNCGRGFFYGFSTEGKQKDGKMRIQYDETALENEYLLTSRKTGYVLYILVFYNYLLRFAMSFLYEHALNIIHYQATFQAMASHYNDFHLGRHIFLLSF